MEKVVIYGTGWLGYYVGKQLLLHQLVPRYEIMCYCGESDQSHEPIHGYEVITLDRLQELTQDFIVIVATADHTTALMRLLQRGFRKIYYVTETNRFLKEFIFPEAASPDLAEFPRLKEAVPLKKILYVQESLCTRTKKISLLMKQQGIEVDFAYHSRVPDDQMVEHFGRVFHIDSIADFLAFVNDSDYDLLHVSNERDFLCALCCTTNKPVVHDCHDIASIEFDISSPETALEYLANRQSNGRIYVSQGMLTHIMRQLGRGSHAPILVLGNLMTEDLSPSTYLEKLSERDGRIHCVYEGGLLPDPTSIRYLEPMFLQLADAGAVVHFYTPPMPKYEPYFQKLMDMHPNLIWENFCQMDKLPTELTKYDLGLFFSNFEESPLGYSIFGASISPNKRLDYLNAGLPVVYNLKSMQQGFYQEHAVGAYINFKAPLLPQLQAACGLVIPKDYIRRKHLQMESHITDIMAFYRQAIAHKKQQLAKM